MAGLFDSVEKFIAGLASAFAAPFNAADWVLVPPALAPSREIPRSWHEAWLDTLDAPGQSDVPDFTAGRFPTSCDDRHEWHLTTAQGTRDTTTWCTRPAFHTGRHAQGSLIRVNGSPLRDRVVAVWQYP